MVCFIFNVADQCINQRCDKRGVPVCCGMEDFKTSVPLFLSVRLLAASFNIFLVINITYPDFDLSS